MILSRVPKKKVYTPFWGDWPVTIRKKLGVFFLFCHVGGPGLVNRQRPFAEEHPKPLVR